MCPVDERVTLPKEGKGAVKWTITREGWLQACGNCMGKVPEVPKCVG